MINKLEVEAIMERTKHLFPFEKLEVSRDAKELIIEIYRAAKIFPAEEHFGLANQLKRAAVSVASNIAEDASRMSYRDQAHFTQLAYSSLMEVACQLIIARDLQFIAEEKYEAARDKIEELSRKLNALRISQVKRTSK